jgi:hypothetical protein
MEAQRKRNYLKQSIRIYAGVLKLKLQQCQRNSENGKTHGHQGQMALVLIPGPADSGCMRQVSFIFQLGFLRML